MTVLLDWYTTAVRQRPVGYARRCLSVCLSSFSATSVQHNDQTAVNADTPAFSATERFHHQVFPLQRSLGAAVCLRRRTLFWLRPANPGG